MISTALSPAKHLEHVAAEVAKQAAELVRDSIGAAATAGVKSTPTDVVTHTDLASERLIRAELLRRCPGSTIIGEEYDDQVGHNDIGWIVDPIDGTVNFLFDLPVVSVSIAATSGGVTVAGAVADVLRGEIFTATRGEGAALDGRPITASNVDDLSQALVGTGFSYRAEVRATEAEIVAGLLPACRDIRCMGSAALNLCWVACGRLSAFYERDIKLYDYAAGALIAEEAGATVELPGADGSAGANDLTIAAPGGVFDALRDQVGGHR